MIFIDSNIPMYLIGDDHPNKWETKIILERFVSEKKKLVTNTEVFQEIMHRYAAIKRKDAIQYAFDAIYGFIDEIHTILEIDIYSAKDLLISYKSLSSRDAIHAANMRRLKIKTIFSFDKGFDQLPFMERIPK